jgi:ribonuclease HI
VTYTIYTDGGCSKNTKAIACPGAYAFIIVDDKENVIKKDCGRFESTTNNRMELIAAIEGLKSLINAVGPRSCDCIVVTDSRYMSDGYHDYLPSWKTNGWRKTNGSSVLNKDLWKMLSELSPEFKSLNFQWVRGHAENRYNCEADEMVQKTLFGTQKSTKSAVTISSADDCDIACDSDLAQ